MSTKTQPTTEALYQVPENAKAEIVNGEVVLMSPTGGRSGRAGGEIFASLREYERKGNKGYAFPDNVGFLVNLPNRESFSPDAAFYTGAIIDEDFLEGAPILAVEVRSKNDYGAKAEKKITDKIADYFAAGTLVVWDVDVIKDRLVRVYRAHDPHHPTIYHSGEIAEAEPALPGWKLPVDDLFV